MDEDTEENAEKAMHEEYMEEIKAQFKTVVDANKLFVKNSLYLMSFIGIIMAAAVGLTLVEHRHNDLTRIIGTFGIILMVLSLIKCASVIKSRDMKIPIVSKNLLKTVSGENELNKTYDEWAEADPVVYYRNMSLLYLNCIQFAEESNKKLSRKFSIARGLFVAGITVYALQIVIIGT